MIIPLLDRIRKFQDHLLSIGAAQLSLALPAPRTLALAAPSHKANNTAFAQSIEEPEIQAVSRDLFASGHYSLSVAEAFKAVEKYVQSKVSHDANSGTQLMQNVFSPHKPQLFWTERKTNSEQDEQKGYMMLFSGAMLGIRNPVTHELNWIEDEHIALELILFAQHLLRKAKCARS